MNPGTARPDGWTRTSSRTDPSTRRHLDKSADHKGPVGSSKILEVCLEKSNHTESIQIIMWIMFSNHSDDVYRFIRLIFHSMGGYWGDIAMIPLVTSPMCSICSMYNCIALNDRHDWVVLGGYVGTSSTMKIHEGCWRVFCSSTLW